MRKFLTILVLFISVYCNGQKLKITLYNKTGYDIDSVYFECTSINNNVNKVDAFDSVYFESTYIGTIKNSDSAIVTNCPSIIFTTDSIPYMRVQGSIKNKIAIKILNVNQKSKEGIYIDSGIYKFDINIYESSYGYSLWWKKHK